MRGPMAAIAALPVLGSAGTWAGAARSAIKAAG